MFTTNPSVHQWNLTVERDLGKAVGLRLSYDGSHGSDLGVQGMLNAPPVNTIGYGKAAALAPYALWSILQTEVNGGWSNYHAFTASVNKRFSQGRPGSTFPPGSGQNRPAFRCRRQLLVGRTPWSAAGPLAGFFIRSPKYRALSAEADGGVGRGPGGPPHQSTQHSSKASYVSSIGF